MEDKLNRAFDARFRLRRTLNNQQSDEKSKQIKSENQNLSLLSLSQKNNAQKDGSPPCRGKRDALPLCHETVSRERRRAGRGARQGDTSDCRTVALLTVRFGNTRRSSPSCHANAKHEDETNARRRHERAVPADEGGRS